MSISVSWIVSSLWKKKSVRYLCAFWGEITVFMFRYPCKGSVTLHVVCFKKPSNRNLGSFCLDDCMETHLRTFDIELKFLEQKKKKKKTFHTSLTFCKESWETLKWKGFCFLTLCLSSLLAFVWTKNSLFVFKFLPKSIPRSSLPTMRNTKARRSECNLASFQSWSCIEHSHKLHDKCHREPSLSWGSTRIRTDIRCLPRELCLQVKPFVVSKSIKQTQSGDQLRTNATSATSIS